MLLFFVLDVDECLTMFASCGNGLCVNTVGSFRCECNEGYTPSQAGTVCVGKYADVQLKE